MNEVNKLQSALNAIHKKEELSSDLLELANQAVDIEKKAQSAFNDARSIAQDAVSDAVRKMVKKEGVVQQLINEAEFQIKRLEKFEKEIGEPIKAKQKYIRAKKEAESYINAITKKINSLKAAEKA